MFKLSKQLLIVVKITSLNVGVIGVIYSSVGMYDMRPKNSFRGGSRGKGGKIKYQRG